MASDTNVDEAIKTLDGKAKDIVDEVANLNADTLNYSFNLRNIDMMLSNPQFDSGSLYWSSPSVEYFNVADGVAKFKANATGGRIAHEINPTINETYYIVAKVKSDSNLVYLTGSNNLDNHSGSGQFEILSGLKTYASSVDYLQIRDYRTSNWTEVSVEYAYFYSIDEMKLNNVKNDEGVSFELLSNEDIKNSIRQVV